MISNFRHVLNIVCILLGISPASDCCLPTFRNPLSLHTLHPALEDGTDRGFRNVGKQQSDAGEIPKRIHTIILHSILHGINKHIKHYQEKWCDAQGQGLTQYMSDEIVAGNSRETRVVTGD